MALHAVPDHAFEPKKPSMHLQLNPNLLSSSTKSLSEHGNLQSVWDESMRGVGDLGLPHKQCAVLLMNWEEAADDLDTGQEVQDLEATFKNLYNYEVTKAQLLGPASTDKSPQIQVSKILVDFVYKHDKENTLLIIYYAGHGVPVTVEDGAPGGLFLSGNRQPRTKTNQKNAVVWEEAEVFIKRTKGDVLVIFDCCHAGVLGKPTRSASERSFEFLAACGAKEVTAMPSDASFTSALIWSLRSLSTKPSFTTQQLLRKINEKAPHFPRDQHALLIERDEDDTSCVRKLVLAPLPKPGHEDERAFAKFAPEDAKPKDKIKHFLDLRFFYDKPPTKSEVLFLSESLKTFIANEKITVRHIGWVRMTDIAKNAADRWRRRRTIKETPMTVQWVQKFAAAARRHSGNHSPMTPPRYSGQCDSSFEGLPEMLHVQTIETSNISHVDTASVSNIENMNVAQSDTINLNIGSISTQTLRKLLAGGSSSQHMLEVLIVGLAVLVLEAFYPLRPREAPLVALFSFFAYAWHMRGVQHRHEISRVRLGLASYYPLLVGGILWTICWELSFTYRGVTT